LTGALLCLDFTVSAGTVTFSSTGTLAVSGSMTLLAGTLWTATGRITFNATTTGKTLTTNGVSFAAPFTFSGAGGAWTLSSALTTTAILGITVTAGTFSTSATNYSVTATGITVNGGTLTLNASTITLTSTAPFTYTSGTVNAGTSQITMTSSPVTFAGGGQTYYNVSSTGNFPTGPIITGTNTFNNLTVSATSAKIKNLVLSANQTVNGTLTVEGASASSRIFVLSNTIGTTRTITAAAISATDCDFRDITLAGAAAGASPTRAGDCKGNSGITFPAAKTVYWNLAGSSNWSATAWATSAGGAVNINNFPLAQDTAIFTATSPTTGETITVDGSYNFGTIDMSARTSNTISIQSGNTEPTIYGNWTNGTATTTVGGNYPWQFSGRGSQTITSAGNTFSNQGTTINSPSGTVTLQDAFTATRAVAGVLTLTNGTLNLNGQTLTLSGTIAATFLTATGTKNLTFNGGTLSIAASGTTAFNNAAPTGFTTTAGTGTGTISLTSASAKTFVGGGSTYNCTLNNGGAGALTISGSNTFTTLSNTVQPTTFTFTSGTTQTLTNWSVSGTAGNLVTIGATAASAATLSKASGTVNASFLSISYSTATGGATWNATNSINSGNNTGWNISTPSTGFLLFF
jgi:fibronectin-binding autotransporter adhesin